MSAGRSSTTCRGAGGPPAGSAACCHCLACFPLPPAPCRTRPRTTRTQSSPAPTAPTCSAARYAASSPSTALSSARTSLPPVSALQLRVPVVVVVVTCMGAGRQASSCVRVQACACTCGSNNCRARPAAQRSHIQSGHLIGHTRPQADMPKPAAHQPPHPHPPLHGRMQCRKGRPDGCRQPRHRALCLVTRRRRRRRSGGRQRGPEVRRQLRRLQLAVRRYLVLKRRVHLMWCGVVWCGDMKCGDWRLRVMWSWS